MFNGGGQSKEGSSEADGASGAGTRGGEYGADEGPSSNDAMKHMVPGKRSKRNNEAAQENRFRKLARSRLGLFVRHEEEMRNLESRHYSEMKAQVKSALETKQKKRL